MLQLFQRRIAIKKIMKKKQIRDSVFYSLNVALYYRSVLIHTVYTYGVSTFLGHFQTPKMEVVFYAETPMEFTGLHGVTFQKVLISTNA
jgi:hypothetical protein